MYIPVFALALMAQAAQPDAGSGPSPAHTDIVRLIFEASLLSQVVLLILLIFSAIGWGVTLYKLFGYSRAARQSASFLDVFRKSSKFSEVLAVCPSLDLALTCTDVVPTGKGLPDAGDPLTVIGATPPDVATL